MTLEKGGINIKEKLLTMCRENEREIELLIEAGYKMRNRHKIAIATTAIINALCGIDDLTIHNVEMALKRAGEFINDVAKDEVMN